MLQDLSDSAIPLVYTDGSSVVEGHAGRLAGYGIFCEKQTSIAAFVPDEYRQTNNSAELLAVIRALRIFSTGDIAICTDSQYVVLGATGAARRWRLRGWIGSCGPVSNVPLWEQLLAALDENPRTVHWVKVPSHVTIEGNNEADRLADQGRQLHPRFPHRRTPSLLLSVAGTPSAPKKPKPLTLDSSPLPVKRLNSGAQASPPLIHSIEGQAVLTTLNLTLMADAPSTTSDISHCDTDSWSETLTVQASSALARAPQKAVVTNCFVSAGAVVSTPVYHPHTLPTSYCMSLPALFETKQQLKGTGRMSAMLCSPVSSQVVQ